MATLACTGSRPKGLYGYGEGRRGDYAAVVDGLARVLERIALLDADAPTVFLSGGAQGADQLFYAAAARVRRSLPAGRVRDEVCIPFRGQEAPWNAEGLFSRASYRAMLEDADAVAEASPLPRRTSYMARNRMMVRRADALVVVSLRDPWLLGARSGTGATARMAVMAGVPVWRYDPGSPCRLLPLGRWPGLGPAAEDAGSAFGRALDREFGGGSQ